MAKKVLTLIKLQIPGGQANPAPPVGPALGQHGVNIMEFCKAFNAQTAHENGRIIPVEITVFEDRSFTFITKTPPAAVLIKEALDLEKGSGEPNREQGRPAHPGAAALDRRDEDARPERERRRAGDAGHRRHGSLDGRGGGAREAHGRRTARRARQIDREQAYPPADAVKLLKELPDAKFDETVEVHFRLGLNVRHADQQLRGTLMLPNGTGKRAARRRVRRGREGREAEEAGADVVGAADLATKIEGGFDDFDVAVATPDMMGTVGKLGRILGPRGQDAEPEDRHGHVRHRQGRPRREGGQARVPHRPRREHPSARSARRASASGSCSRTTPPSWRRSSAPSRRGEGPLYPRDHADDDDGPRHPRRPNPHPRHRRGRPEAARPASGCNSLAPHSGPPPKTAGSPEAEARPRRSVRGRDVFSCPLPAGSSFPEKETMLKTEKEKIVAELTERLRSTGDAHRRRLPRPVGEARSTSCAGKLLEQRRELHRRQELADASRGRGRRAPTRCSRCSRARPRLRSSRPTATPSPSRRRWPNSRRRRRSSRFAAA